MDLVGGRDDAPALDLNRIRDEVTIEVVEADANNREDGDDPRDESVPNSD